MWSWRIVDVWTTSTARGAFVFALFVLFFTTLMTVIWHRVLRFFFSGDYRDLEQTLPSIRSNNGQSRAASGFRGLLAALNSVVWGFVSFVRARRRGFRSLPAALQPCVPRRIAPQVEPPDVIQSGVQLHSSQSGLINRHCNLQSSLISRNESITFQVGSDDFPLRRRFNARPVETKVGLKSSVRVAKRLLRENVSLGLYGMGGIGKTTLAEAVFQDLSSTGDFKFSCFVHDIKELVKRFQGDELMSKMLESLEYRARPLSREEKASVDWSALQNARVLLVLDDVESEDQLRDIPWKGLWFGKGSRLIITSRHKNFCERICESSFHVKSLNNDESRRLFLHHACFERMGSKLPNFLNDQNGPLQKILDICGGIPLALEVLGKCLFKETAEDVWLGTLAKLEQGEPVDGDRANRLLNSLKLSVDACARAEQELFLDAAILYTGESLTKTLETWMALKGLGVKRSWENLRSKSLVDVIWKQGSEGGVIWVHEQLRALARGMCCRKDESMQSWSRIKIGSPHKWNELLNTLDSEEARFSAQAKVVRFPNPPALIERSFLVGNPYNFSREVFSHLTVLKLEGVDIQGENLDLPSKLVVFSWYGAALEHCPFQLKNSKQLQILHLEGWAHLKAVPSGLDACTELTSLKLIGCRSLESFPLHILKNFEKLKVLHLDEIPLTSREIIGFNLLTTLRLINTPISKLPEAVGQMRNLEVLDMKHTQLTTLPEAVGQMRNLEVLDMKHTQLTTLPESIGEVRQLSKLILTCSPLIAIPQSVGKMQNLKVLPIIGTYLTTVPDSIGQLQQLLKLFIINSPLVAIPQFTGTMENLGTLCGRDNELTTVPVQEFIDELQELEWLDISQTEISTLPNSSGPSKFSKLLPLNLVNNTLLQSLPKSIDDFSNLCSLDHTEMILTTLPNSIGKLKKIWSLILAKILDNSLPKLIAKLGTSGMLDTMILHQNLDELLINFPQLGYLKITHKKAENLYEVFLFLKSEMRVSEQVGMIHTPNPRYVLRELRRSRSFK